jgi:cardiolipin synthase A/B
MLDITLHQGWLLYVEIGLLLLGLLFSIFLLSDVLKQRRAPAATTAWLLVILLLPYLGVLLYLLFGARKLDRPRMRIARLPTPNHPAIIESLAHPVDLLLRGLGAGGAVAGHQVLVHTTPEQALVDLLRVISSAQHRLMVDMYAIADDQIGKQVFAALTERAANGVAVYVLLDDIGSAAVRSANAQALRAAGGKLVRFKPVAKLFRLRFANLRNHRKIVVADARLAWTGGRNIATQYLTALHHPDAWQDASCSIEGFAASTLDDIARSDWRFATGERLLELKDGLAVPVATLLNVGPETTSVLTAPEHATQSSSLAPSTQGSIVQVVPSGPDLRDDLWHSALMSLCFTAKRRIWLVTPYFVPDEALQNALALAARRGIEVKLIVPKRSDNRLVDLVRVSYLQELNQCGAEVLQYMPRMLHAKLALFDDQLAAIGTANLDARSLFLNYEVMSVFYSHNDIADVGGFIRLLERDCRAYKPRAHWLRDVLAAPLKLLAPLL